MKRGSNTVLGGGGELTRVKKRGVSYAEFLSVALKGFGLALVFMGSFTVAGLSASVFMAPAETHADRVTATLNASGYTMQVTSNGFTNIDVAATPDGALASAKDVVNVKTNSPGYHLYLAGDASSAASNKLYKDGDETSSYYLDPTSGTFSTPATLGTNTWGYAVPGAGGFDATYITPQPTSTSKWAAIAPRGQEQLIHASSAASATEGDNVDVYYGVKANNALASGVYSGKITYTAVVNSQLADLASVSPARLTQLAGGQTVTVTTSLNAPASGVGNVTVSIGGKTCTNPSASNAGDGSVVITCTSPSNNSGFYDVEVGIENYSKVYYIANGIEYYQEAQKTLNDISTMQEMTSAICANTPTPKATDTTVPTKVLTDVRGKNGSGTLASPASGSNAQTYVVKKFADGNCWMTQNLNMTLSTNVTLNSTTSDLNSKTTWTPQNNTQTTEGTVWAQNGGDVARSFEPGENIYFPNGIGTGAQDTYGNYSGYATSGDPWYHIGNYYNWYAATAGSGTAAMGSDGVEVQAIDSICPKGWKLPDNVGDKSFINLTSTTYGLIDNDTTSATKLLEQPLSFVRSGNYAWGNGRVYDKGYSGNWWSTAAYSSASSHYLPTLPSRVIPQYGSYKGYGLSVRCVAR